MNLKSFLEQARDKGEKIKNQVLDQVVHSSTLKDLLKNDQFINTVATVLEAKGQVEEFVNNQVENFYQAFEIPSKKEVESLHKKIHQLENEVETLHRKVVTQKLRQKVKPSTPVKPKPKKR